jgi:hypothetical protein
MTLRAKADAKNKGTSGSKDVDDIAVEDDIVAVVSPPTAPI